MMALLNDWLSDPHLQEVCPRKSVECWLNGTIKQFRLIEILVSLDCAILQLVPVS